MSHWNLIWYSSEIETVVHREALTVIYLDFDTGIYVSARTVLDPREVSIIVCEKDPRLIVVERARDLLEMRMTEEDGIRYLETLGIATRVHPIHKQLDILSKRPA